MSLYIPRSSLEKKKICYLLKFSKAGGIITTPLRSLCVKEWILIHRMSVVKGLWKNQLFQIPHFSNDETESCMNELLAKKSDSEGVANVKRSEGSLWFPTENNSGEGQWQELSFWVIDSALEWKWSAGPLCDNCLITIEGSEWRCELIQKYSFRSEERSKKHLGDLAPSATQPCSDLPPWQCGMTFPSVSGTWNSIRDSFGPASNLPNDCQTLEGKCPSVIMYNSVLFSSLFFFESLIKSALTWEPNIWW